jgi:LysM repeat protein
VTAPPRATAPEGWRTHLVQPGDTLGQIATCRGVSVAELARANGLADPDLLLAGSRLLVPPRDRCTAAAPQGLGGEIELARVEPAPGGVELEQRARTLFEAARAHYDAAHFDEALSEAEMASAELLPSAGQRDSDALRARCYLLAGMAAAALDQRERAIALFRASLALEPQPSLAREETSPRILELVEEARARAPDEVR